MSTADATNAQQARSKAAILRVLNADQDLSKIYTALAPDSTPSQVAVAVGKYCEALEKLDMDNCPADFRVAYRQHMRAWREAETALKQLPDGFLEGFFMGAVNALLRAEADGGQGRLEGDCKRAFRRVHDTWEEVERIGAKYDAAL